MKFKSKIDWWFHLVILICLISSALPIILGIVNSNTTSIIVGAVTGFFVALTTLPIYFNTHYTLGENTLHIRCGFFINEKISYKDIKKIYETKDPLASAGLSLDRISMNYSAKNGISNVVLISPVKKQEFMRLLKERII